MSGSVEFPAGTWNIDTETTSVEVSVKKLKLITVSGRLDVSAGTIVVDHDHRVASVDVVLDAASYHTGNAKRDAHVKSSDFLDVDQHPTIRLRAADVRATSSGHVVKGALVVNGVSAPAELSVDDLAISGDRATFTATTTVGRRSLGVTKMPNFVVGDELTVRAVVHASIER